jgi:hypothetical protein
MGDICRIIAANYQAQGGQPLEVKVVVGIPVSSAQKSQTRSEKRRAAVVCALT